MNWWFCDECGCGGDNHQEYCSKYIEDERKKDKSI